MIDSNKWDDISGWIGKSSKIFLKKLSRNDCSWADDRKKHQYGFYIPAAARSSGYFPELKNSNPDKPHIFQAELISFWPRAGELKISNIRHFSNKGSEVQMTGVPRSDFSGLTPASWLISGILKAPLEGASHWFMTIDSASEEAELLESVLDLDSDFHFDVFDPLLFREKFQLDETDLLIRELGAALQTGKLSEFIRLAAKLPDPGVFASRARQTYLQENGLLSLDPFSLAAPGDAIMKISRDVEFRIYKQAELRHRAADVVRILTEGGADLVSSVVRGFSKLDATFLSASQHRKTRAGRSFEHHIASLFKDGNVVFEEQAVTGGRRPDFVLPSLARLKNKNRLYEDALIVAAKTTLRERWKQVSSEKFDCALFLATVDDRVSAEAIADMSCQGIVLVVPESLKESSNTCYKKNNAVISFKDFFESEIRRKRSGFIVASHQLI